MDEALEVSSKPVEGNCEVPPPVRVAGHIVNAQLFVTVNVAEYAPAYMEMCLEFKMYVSLRGRDRK